MLRRHLPGLALGLAAASLLAACASGNAVTGPAQQQQADRFLYERGSEALENSRWLAAREYFRTLVDTYPTSEYRQDAKLGVGDSYLGEGGVENDILAATEFREFLRFFPLAERADYAQYRLALSQVRQILRPERDQTATRDALRELQTFVETYPGSEYLPEVLRVQRETRDRLSESELIVGKFYFDRGIYPGAISRLEALLEVDPSFSDKDQLYYYLAESYYRMNRLVEALPLFERLLTEYAVSEYLDEAEQRVTELRESVLDEAPAAADATEG